MGNAYSRKLSEPLHLRGDGPGDAAGMDRSDTEGEAGDPPGAAASFRHRRGFFLFEHAAGANTVDLASSLQSSLQQTVDKFNDTSTSILAGSLFTSEV